MLSFFTFFFFLLIPFAHACTGKTAGRRHVLIQKLEAKYAGSKFPVSTMYLVAVRAYLQRVDPVAAKKSEIYLEKYKGREAALVAKLEEKYSSRVV